MSNSTINVKKLSDIKSIREFGGVGDGVTDDTAAFASASTYFYTTGYPVYLPVGTWLTDAFTINYNPASAGSTFGFFFGDNEEKTIIKRRTTGAGTFITLGSISNTAYISNVEARGFTIEGGATTNGPAFEANRIVRTSFESVRFTGGSTACKINEAINVTFKDCKFDNANTGLFLTSHNSSIDASPNNVNIYGGFIGDNVLCGINYNYGRLLNLNGVEIEGNGTTLGNTSQGGLIVGTSVGGSDSASIPIGVTATDCWFEANKGIADAYLQSGQNTLINCLFWSQAADVTNDIRITGGRYHIENCFSRISKTVNVYEGAGTFAGNTIIGSLFQNLTWTTSKTTLITDRIYTPSVTSAGAITSSTTISATGNVSTRSINVVPAWNTDVGASFAKPVIVSGTSVSGSSADVTISFGKTFANTTSLRVSITPAGVPATYIAAPEVSSISTTGMVIKKNGYGAGSVQNVNYAFYWMVIGEEA